MDGLTIDVGLFDTIYGAEVADSWVNFNYTRSPLNYLMQPFYHLGVRATYEVSDRLDQPGPAFAQQGHRKCRDAVEQQGHNQSGNR